MANFDWVGGSGTWNNAATTHWSTSSGGSGGAGPPTSADNATFDSLSNATAYAVSVAATAVCLNFNVPSGPASSGNVTFSGSNASCYGSMTFGTANITYSTGVLFASTSVGNTITSNGVTIVGTIVFNGVGGSWALQDNLTNISVFGTTLTNGALDLNNKLFTCSQFLSNNSNVRTLAFGSGSMTVTGSGTAWATNTATNMTVTGTPVVNITYAGATATSVAPGSPSEANSITFNVSAGTETFTTSGSYKNLNFTGFAGTLTLNFTAVIYGDLTFASGMSITSAANAFTFSATSGVKKLTSAGLTVDNPITMNGVGGTIQLQDNLTLGATRALTLTNGTIDFNGKTVSMGTLSSSNSNTRTIAFGTAASVTINASGTAWNAATTTGLTITGSATISMAAASAKTFAGGGASWPTLNQGGAGALTVTGSNTFANITNSVQPCTISLTAGTTTTVTTIGLAGTAGNQVTLQSATASAHTISCASGTISLSNVTLVNSHATGGATFNAYITNGCVDGGGNTGWVFAQTVSATGVSDGGGLATGYSASIGVSAGVGAASAVGQSTATTTATADGASTVVGLGASIGVSAGVGAASAVGQSTETATATALGSGAANGLADSIGVSAGEGAASGVGRSTATSTGTAAGSGSATAVGVMVLSAVGVSAGVGTASGAAQAIVVATGVAAGFGVAAGVGALTTAVGVAAGAGMALASPTTPVGSALGVGSAFAIGQAIDTNLTPSFYNGISWWDALHQVPNPSGPTPGLPQYTMTRERWEKVH